MCVSGGLDTDEPWQGRWEGGVLVECHGEPERKGQDQTDPLLTSRTSWTADKIHALQISLCQSYHSLFHFAC